MAFDPTAFTPAEVELLCQECGGRCCFCIPYTHSMIDIEAFVERGDVTAFVDSKAEHAKLLHEFQFIAENWQQISILDAKEQAPYDIPGWSTEDGASHYFSCSQFDPETLKCSAYEKRPANCRGFPFFGKQDTSDTSDYLECLLVKEAKRRLRNQRRRQRRDLEAKLRRAGGVKRAR